MGEHRISLTPVSGTETMGPSSFITARTLDIEPEPPGEVEVVEWGYNFISLEATKPSKNQQCINGLSAFCVESPRSSEFSSTTQPPETTTSPFTSSTAASSKASSVLTLANLEVCT